MALKKDRPALSSLGDIDVHADVVRLAQIDTVHRKTSDSNHDRTTNTTSI